MQRTVFQASEPRNVYVEKRSTPMPEMPAGMEMRLRTTGMQRHTRTLVCPCFLNQPMALETSPGSKPSMRRGLVPIRRSRRSWLRMRPTP